ncbi:MAG: hypothetical protein KBT48_01815, partial [Firmicutes bacterium]|nr:hypothetical protein [Bacillota bacterium]
NCTILDFSLEIKNRTSFENENLRMHYPVQVFVEWNRKPLNILSLYMYSEWWSRPAFIQSYTEIPRRTQVLFFQYPESVGCFVPVVGNTYKTHLTNGTDNELCFEMTSGMGGYKRVQDPLFVYSEAKTLEEAVHNCFEWLAKYKGIKTKEQKRVPDMFNYLGWCSWDAFYKEVNESLIQEKVQELSSKQVPVRWALIDDGWLQEKEEILFDLKPDPQKFPNQFKDLIQEMKNNSSISWVGVWHALAGYWGGILPNSAITQTEGKYLCTTANEKIIPDPDKTMGFYKDWYEYLHRQGVDFVKVDGQSSLSYYVENTIPVAKACKEMHQSLEGGALYMDEAVINCMGMAMESVLSRPNTLINRNSDDFVPMKEGSFNEHLLQNAYNALYQDELYMCDWDMFWTIHEDANKHALLRAISGGPIYVSDKIGQTNPEVLKPLVYLDGKCIRMDHAAKPTPDCLFVDPFKTGMIKLQNTLHQNMGGIAIFNLSKETKKTTYSSKDIVGLKEANSYWVYDFNKKEVSRLRKEESVEIGVEANSYAWIQFFPEEECTILGLINKYVSQDGLQTKFTSNKQVTCLVKEMGDFGWVSKQEPKEVYVNQEKVEVEKKEDFYFVKVQEQNTPMLVQIIY